MSVINIYSDETNHLKDPKQGNNMVIGGVWCKKESVKSLSDAIRKVKEYHGFAKNSELKWTKISQTNSKLYEDIVKLFFNFDMINFRAVIIPKDGLHHDLFSQTDDEFYYKMQYLMATNIVKNNHACTFNIYIDYKDIWSNYRAKKLESYLCNKIDFAASKFSAQPVRSYESELIQLADILIGATSYRSNHIVDGMIDTPKKVIVELIEQNAMQRLNQSSPSTSEKVNVFLWSPRG
jgi:hypothetical protein